jgi:hypothetical protein
MRAQNAGIGQGNRVFGSARVSVTETIGKVSTERIYGPSVRNLPNTKAAPRVSLPGRDSHARKVGKTKLRYASPADAYAATARKLAELNGQVSVTETIRQIPREDVGLPSAVTSIRDGRDVRIIGTVPRGNELISPDCHQSLTGSEIKSPRRAASVERIGDAMRHRVAVNKDVHHACMVSASALRDGVPERRAGIGSIRSTVKLGDGKGL